MSLQNIASTFGPTTPTDHPFVLTQTHLAHAQQRANTDSRVIANAQAALHIVPEYVEVMLGVEETKDDADVDMSLVTGPNGQSRSQNMEPEVLPGSHVDPDTAEALEELEGESIVDMDDSVADMGGFSTSQTPEVN
jgi:hypothetical protein